MSRVVGIDRRANHVRAVAFRVGYRKLELEGMTEELIASHESEADAIRACVHKLPAGSFDTVVAAVDGARCFSHRIALPTSAKKRLAELLPFELEAVLPLDVDDLLIDHLPLHPPRVRGEGNLAPADEFSILCVATRIEHVQAEIERYRAAIEHQPERVGCNPAELGHLAHLTPGLRQDEPVALLDFGFSSTDICVLDRGVVALVRTLSIGVENFPDQADACSARLRQTFDAYATSTGEAVKKIVLLGEGASMSELGPYLAANLDVEIVPFPEMQIEGMQPLDVERVPHFARAMGLAIHAMRGKGLDLRKGPLAFEQGYEHLKARAPLSAALVAAVLLSFLFSVWAESRALANEREALLVSLQEVTQSTFGIGTDDPDQAEVELQKARKVRPDDPMPYLDGFGAAVALAEKLPDDLTHDVEEFEFAKGKLKLRGQVDSAEDAQKVAKVMAEHRCFVEPKVTKITQVVNSERERYVLESEVGCPEDGSSSRSKKSSGDDE